LSRKTARRRTRGAGCRKKGDLKEANSSILFRGFQKTLARAPIDVSILHEYIEKVLPRDDKLSAIVGIFGRNG